MISLRQPSLVLNSYDVPGYEYSMWQTWKMPKGARPSDVVYWIQYARDHSPELYLKHVVINCHGGDGKLYIGKDNSGNHVTINNYNVGIFQQLRGKADIGTIWLVACKVASSGIGKYFCGELAKAAGCDVVAADVVQTGWNSVWGTLFMPYGDIDDYEGKVYRWDAAGGQETFYPNGRTF